MSPAILLALGLFSFAQLAQAQQPCVACPSSYTQAYDNTCYKATKPKKFEAGLANSCPWDQSEMVTSFYELGAAAEVLGLKAMWSSLMAPPGGDFSPAVPVRPGSDRSVKARGAKRCLAYRAKTEDRAAMFFPGNCKYKCPFICKVKKECRRRTTFAFKGKNYELEAFFLVENKAYYGASKFCQKLGGSLPVISTKKARNAARGALNCDGSSANATPPFWVNAKASFKRKVYQNMVKWIQPDGSMKPQVNNALIDITEPQLPSERFYYERNAGATGQARIIPSSANVKRPVVCMFECGADMVRI